MKSIKIACIGYEIAADWYQNSGDAVLLVLTGYDSAKKNYREYMPQILKQSNASALVIDYSGHGESPFDLAELTPAQNFLEVVTAFDWIKESHPDRIIYVMGISYGGFMATQLTKYRKFEKLVLRAPAIYPPQDFYTKWKYFDQEYIKNVYRKRTDLIDHPLLARASKFSGKTLLVVHEKDEIIPVQTTDAYMKAFGAEEYIAKDFTHVFREINDIKKIRDYLDHVSDWLAK